ncbi:hypothetical protein ACN2C7_16925 [Caulobacter sp. ErkDOM-E]|uniref:hypothetical protein n=1 Tax=Caulobacter sp. ErkDOM-E TaxID=3402778 RepID=UPI003AF591C6
MAHHALTASLRLVHAPLSNQDADILRNIRTKGAKSLKSRLGEAPIYMIAQREEIFFSDRKFDQEEGVFSFSLVMGDKRLSGRVDVAFLSARYGDPNCASLGFRDGATTIYVLDIDERGKKTAVWAASPDALLYQHWRKEPGIKLDGDVRAFATYRLLYIGMSEDGAYNRLIKAPHHARLGILSNEYQIRAEARLTDEVYFFLFEIDPLQIRSWGPDDEISEDFFERMASGDSGLPQANLICDVEKAFIRMLDTKYNNVKYSNYPHVAGGISSLGIDSYAYVIAEDITFEVQGQRVDGGYAEGLPSSNYADFILVSGDDVALIDVSENKEFDFGVDAT